MDKRSRNVTVIAIVLTIVISSFTFAGYCDSLIYAFEDTAKSRQTEINNEIMPSHHFIQALTIYGNTYFRNSSADENVEFYDSLLYNPDLDIYTLDSIGGTIYEKKAGNLTGLGSIPESGIERENLNLALNFNAFFDTVAADIPDIACIYYTSENHFANIYPWIASNQFLYSEKLNNAMYYTMVSPENNPLRVDRWTPVYLDPGGTELIVSLASPIYDDDTFMGVVSIDFTTKRLNELLDCEYEAFLFDESDSVLATNRVLKIDKEIPKLQKIDQKPGQ